jgi:hypothetical protein
MNETLADAEHLEIPGVIMKPSHKSPDVRYQIDRLFLIASGVEMEEINRIYRGLFVYSIGFYEMLAKCLAHAQNKYTLLANVWKVYSILLEYCCKTNYRMMITELTNQFQKTLDSELDKKQQDINVKEIIEKKLKLQLDDL